MNTKQRYERAIRVARAAGVTVKTNVRRCCDSCTTAADLDMTEQEIETEPYAYFLNTQGRQVNFRDGEPTEKTNAVTYFGHGNGGGEVVAAAFREQGFDVEWDGTDMKKVGVVLKAKVAA